MDNKLPTLPAYDARTASHAMRDAIALATDLLKFEHTVGVIVLPKKEADKLEALEARRDMLVDWAYAKLMAPFGAEATQVAAPVRTEQAEAPMEVQDTTDAQDDKDDMDQGLPEL